MQTADNPSRCLPDAFAEHNEPWALWHGAPIFLCKVSKPRLMQGHKCAPRSPIFRFPAKW
nr:MAG TPA: hypothetical protein [Caudoviricetes sp.]